MLLLFTMTIIINSWGVELNLNLRLSVLRKREKWTNGQYDKRQTFFFFFPIYLDHILCADETVPGGEVPVDVVVPLQVGHPSAHLGIKVTLLL